MNPRLIAISGPLRGTVFALGGEEVSIGRAQSNRLCIADIAVSRRHSIIRADGAGFKINDLDSRNGTFVNGVPVKERALSHGDRIEVGDSVFLFLVEEGEAAAPVSQVEIAEGRIITHPTIQLRREDAVYLQPEKMLSQLPPTSRKARDLNALLKISTAINSIRELDALQRRLLELTFEVIPAERGAILLTGESVEEFASVFGLDRQPGLTRPVQVSRTIIRQVLQERVAILSSDISESESLSASQSIVASRINSLLAVPLLVFEKLLGVIYLDTSSAAVRFDEDHLQLLTGIAGIAAVALENARHVQWLELENARLQGEIKIEHNMVGESAPMREVHQFIAKVAPRDSTVLVCGESGTGKELVARAIHLNSPRAQKPFVAMNCAAITESLLESELFGHEKGAFTGALVQTKGKLEAADGGTLFLDEVSELALPLQAKMLRVLQEREFERVGGTRPLHVDIRLIAATNRNLEDAMKSGSFRRDLYFRLNVVLLTLPPLRERREDITLLASYFAAKYSKKCNRRVMGISAEARACLGQYEWPGNVRELENAIERAVVLGSGDLILPEDLPEAILEAEPSSGIHSAQYHEALKDTKKHLILKAVEQAGGSYTEAAKTLGVHPNYLHRLIRNLNLKAELKKLSD
ncbi:MAG TPA: sigma 54-interacting transcriptional regulator [Terriglobia bacterium]|nr:sigma 54-interacting transcriptional regulator [Terriglobia bacterium]